MARKASREAAPGELPYDADPDFGPVLRARPRPATPVAPRFDVPYDAQLNSLRRILLSLVRQDGRDLTARQLTVFLAVYGRQEMLTVSSLADTMKVSRPAITRVMDRLVQFDLIGREDDRDDRRRVRALRTARGMAFYGQLVSVTRAAAEQSDNPSRGSRQHTHGTRNAS